MEGFSQRIPRFDRELRRVLRGQERLRILGG